MVEEVKSYLKIFSTREDKEIERLLESGKDYLESLAGSDLDYETNAYAKQLLFDYCRYVYNGSFEFYENNFRHALLNLQLSEATKAFERGVE